MTNEMRLFGEVDGQIDELDRAGYMTPPFSLAPSPMSGQHYITAVIMHALYDWLMQKLYTEIDESDIARLGVMTIGRRDGTPSGVNLYIYENDARTEYGWPHQADSSGPASRKEGRNVAQETLGGARSFGYQRSFTICQDVWLRNIVYTPRAGLERWDLNIISGAVAGRVAQALLAGSFGVGTGASLMDSFGEFTVEGPFFGEETQEKQLGEAYRLKRWVQFWYRTARERI